MAIKNGAMAAGLAVGVLGGGAAQSEVAFDQPLLAW